MPENIFTTEAHFALFTLKQYRSATVLAAKGHGSPSDELMNSTVMAVNYISKLTGMSPRDILSTV